MDESVCVALITASVVTVVIWVLSRRHFYRALPPGPRWCLPLFGSMFSLGPDIKQTFRTWRRQYGDIFSLYIGSRFVVVLNGFGVIKDALVSNGDVFNERPDVFVSEVTSQGKGISATSGKVWQQQRAVGIACLHGNGVTSGRNVLEIRIFEEINYLLRTIADEKGQRVNLKKIIDASVTNVLCSVIFGKRFDNADPIFVEYLKRCRESHNAVAVLNFMPCLKYLPCDLFNLNRISENVIFIEEEIIKPGIRRQLKDQDLNNVSNYVSAYLKEVEAQKDTNTSVNEENLVKSIKDLLSAGSDSAAASIQWGILYLITHPAVQERCYQEIRTNVGLKRAPVMSDKENLPFVQATIAEVQRCANINPIGVWRSTSSDVTFRGYNIPKGTMIFPVLDSVLMDRELWFDPEQFKPERFLDDKGDFIQRGEWIPFSLGKRSCFGETLAKMELFLFITSLVQQYRFTSPRGATVTLEPDPGFIYKPKPYRVQAFRRNRSRVSEG